MKSSGYSRYLEALHSKETVPVGVIKDLVEHKVHDIIKSVTKIVAGEVNQVFELRTKRNSKFIVRISPADTATFSDELWAIRQCRPLGVPVPEILEIVNVNVNSAQFCMCLMQKSDGELLERGNLDFASINKDVKRIYFNQAGDILASIHSVLSSGYGKVVGKKGKYNDFSCYLTDVCNKNEQLEKVMREAGIHRMKVAQFWKLIKSADTLYNSRSLNLCHGDYFPKHFIVKDGKITCVIDWGEIRSDLVYYDFANWDYWLEDREYLDWLKQGYYQNKNSKSWDDEACHLLKVLIGIEVLDWYTKEGVKEMIEKAKRRLVIAINYFS